MCSQEQEKSCKLMNELISLLKNNLGSNSNTQGNGSGYRGRGRGSFRGGRGGRGNGRGNQHQSQQRGQNGGSGNGQQTSLEVPMVIMVKPIGLELLSVSIVKSRRLTKLITGLLNANF